MLILVMKKKLFNKSFKRTFLAIDKIKSENQTGTKSFFVLSWFSIDKKYFIRNRFFSSKLKKTFLRLRHNK